MNTTTSDWINQGFEAAGSQPYQWPRNVRRAYVLTWPVSAIVRGIVICVLLLAWLVVGGIEFISYRLGCVWRGERDMWN